MGKLIKCHFYYLMNKLMIIVLFLTTLCIIFFSLFTALSFDERMSIFAIAGDYYLSLYEIVKVVAFILALMLFGYSFYSYNDGYHSIIISKKISRTKYFISKVILLISVFTFVYLLFVTIVIITGLLFNIVMDVLMLKSFYNLYITLILYGIISILLMIIFDNIYIVFILIPLSFLGYEKNIYFLIFILPLENKVGVSRTLMLPSWYYIFECLTLFVVVGLIWHKKDLPL